jgi:excisionase family DNA binding protein
MERSSETLLTIKEVATWLRLSTQTIKRMIEDGRLPAHRLGACSYRIVERDALDMFAETKMKGIKNAGRL